MLSGETSRRRLPGRDASPTMARIITATEQEVLRRGVLPQAIPSPAPRAARSRAPPPSSATISPPATLVAFTDDRRHRPPAGPLPLTDPVARLHPAPVVRSPARAELGRRDCFIGEQVRHHRRDGRQVDQALLDSAAASPASRSHRGRHPARHPGPTNAVRVHRIGDAIEVLEYKEPTAPYGLRGASRATDDLIRPRGKWRRPRCDRCRPGTHPIKPEHITETP